MSSITATAATTACRTARVPLRAARPSQSPHKPQSRQFTSSQCRRKPSLSQRLRETKITWKPIPIGLGIAFLGVLQVYRSSRRADDEAAREKDDEQALGTVKPRERIRPSGPWQVQIMSTLPLKAMSRLWGRFNELEIPYYLRVPGFRLYSWIFGVDLSEMAEQDLHAYPNLASFFYRTLRPGARPLDPNPNALLSPADGRVVQFGTIQRGEVEQVKGMTYSLSALLGSQSPSSDDGHDAASSSSTSSPAPSVDRSRVQDEEVIRADEEFARVNGISYTLPNLFSGPPGSSAASSSSSTDQSTKPRTSSEAKVSAALASDRSWWSPASSAETNTALYYLVVYLAPGDYHRFHSPCSWVVSSRRHFAGELFSVSPYLQRTLPGLFTLNERVVLLGRWRHGFFSYTPVGATNVGSIRVNFDRELRTNSLTTDTAADRAAAQAAEKGLPYSGFAEATYHASSPLLRGHALAKGEEMGGFRLGSTIVLVFEAPKGRRPSFDRGWAGVEAEEKERVGGWRWNVTQGQRVRVGEAVGWVQDAE